MVSVYITLAFCLATMMNGSHGTPGQKLHPSDRLRYDRSKARGPMDRANNYKRKESTTKTGTLDSEKAGTAKSTNDTTKATGTGRTSSQSPRRPSVPKCKITASYPYKVSPVIDVVGVRGMFNSILVGYQNPHATTRENKGSMFGWTTVAEDSAGKRLRYTFNVNYVPITVTAQPTAYCALILQPPLEINSLTLKTFTSPARSMKRNLVSTDLLMKFLKKRHIEVITSCCFVANSEETGKMDPEND